MRPNANQLAMRDPALAALMGIVAIGGTNFGGDLARHSVHGESDFGDDYGAEFGDDMGAEFGDDYGAEFGAAAAPRSPRPSPQQLAALWNSHHQKKAHSAKRGALLEPNKGSDVKVERYAFSISQAITMGTAVALQLTGQPDTNIRPQRVTMNAPSPMFAFVSEIKVSNVSVTVGGGVEDAFNYGANGVGQSLDMPTLTPANRATVLGSYSGFVPPGFVGGSAVFFTATFKGPASIVS